MLRQQVLNILCLFHFPFAAIDGIRPINNDDKEYTELLGRPLQLSKWGDRGRAFLRATDPCKS
jgi:hypothetical protein